MPQQLHNLPHLKNIRRSLRANMTPAELVLWEAIKDKKLRGRKFRRQHSIGNHVLDFYCTTEKLVVELDGQGHYTAEGVEMDKERDQFLAELGIRVLRFENQEVMENLAEVLRKIRGEFQSRKQ